MSSQEDPIEQGRIYENPDRGEHGRFSVLRSRSNFVPLAFKNLEIINAALNEQLAGQLTPEQILSIADPHSSVQVRKQIQRMHTSHHKGKGLFAHARSLGPTPNRPLSDVVAIGWVEFADGRSPAVQKERPQPEAANNLVNIRGLYVQPTLGRDKLPLQGQGIGSGLLHFMLSQYPAYMPTMTMDYPELNPKMIPLIESLGFAAVRTWRGHLGGHKADKSEYHGPPVGEVMEALEANQPWLRNWKPLGET